MLWLRVVSLQLAVLMVWAFGVCLLVSSQLDDFDLAHLSSKARLLLCFWPPVKQITIVWCHSSRGVLLLFHVLSSSMHVQTDGRVLLDRRRTAPSSFDSHMLNTPGLCWKHARLCARLDVVVWIQRVSSACKVISSRR